MYLARQAYAKKKKKRQFGKFLSASMVHLGNGSSEGHQQRTVLGKEAEIRLGKAKMTNLRWRSRPFSPRHVNANRPLMKLAHCSSLCNSLFLMETYVQIMFGALEVCCRTKDVSCFRKGSQKSLP